MTPLHLPLTDLSSRSIVQILSSFQDEEIYALCASAEQLSEHPLGKAVKTSSLLHKSSRQFLFSAGNINFYLSFMSGLVDSMS